MLRNKLQQFFFLFVIMFGYNLKAFSQDDFSGVWEGYETMGNHIYSCDIYLKKINNNYLGVVNIKTPGAFEATTLKALINSDKPLLRVNNGLKVNVVGQILAKVENNQLTTYPLGVISNENASWMRLVSVVFDIINKKSKTKLTAKFGRNEIEVVRKEKSIPEEFQKYTNGLFSVNSIVYAAGNKQNNINYNDKGLLKFTVTNNSEFVLNPLEVSISPSGQDHGIVGLNNIKSSFVLEKNKSIQPEIDIYSSFDIPDDSVRFNIKIDYQGVSFFEQTVAVKTNPFFKQKVTTLNSKSESVLSSLKGYYGFDKAQYSPIKPQLQQLIQSGNQLANIWASVFQFMGKGGYEENQEAAIILAKRHYNSMLEGARNGDAEAQYLMFYAIGMGLAGENLSRDVAGKFLKKSSDAKFLPAMYDYAMYLLRDSVYEESLQLLNECYSRGMVKAAPGIAVYYKNGLSVEKDKQMALDWLHKAEAFADPETYLQLAKLYMANDDNVPADTKKGIQYAEKAAALKNAEAMNYLARIYLNGRNGIPKNPVKAISIYTNAANQGNNEAMSSLALLYLYGGESGVKKDEKMGISWAKRGAEAGDGNCMALMAEFYATGKIDGKKDIIKYRFWANQAFLRGFGEADNSALQVATNNLMNIIGNVDLRDQRSFYEIDGNLYSTNDGPDLIGGIFQGFCIAYGQSRKNQQEVINGLKFIYQKGNKKVYGGTLTSKLTTDIMAFEGQKIVISAYGVVNLGMIAGSAGPSGTYGFQSYSIVPSIPHAAIMAGVGNSWSYIGNKASYSIPKDGRLQLAINDVDYTNNKGYFDVVIEVLE